MIGPWTKLEGIYGERFAVNGDWVAGAQDIHLSVWEKRKPVKAILAETRMGGYPTIANQGVYWGNGWWDNSTHSFQAIPNIDSIFNIGTEAPPFVSPLGQYVPHNFAWSPDGSLVLASINWSGKAGPIPSRALLIGKDGELQKIVWEGNGPPPRSALITKDLMILGSSEVSIYDIKGNNIKTLSSESEVIRLEMDKAESLLLVQNYNSLSIWETKNWTKLDIWKGPWADAAFSPFGNMIGAIDFNGVLHIANFDKKIEPIDFRETLDPMRSVKIGENQIVASFSKGDPVRVAQLTSK